MGQDLAPVHATGWAIRDDVQIMSTLKGGGCWQISDKRKGGCVDLVLTRGREGFQNLGNLKDIMSSVHAIKESNCSTSDPLTNEANENFIKFSVSSGLRVAVNTETTLIADNGCASMWP